MTKIARARRAGILLCTLLAAGGPGAGLAADAETKTAPALPFALSANSVLNGMPLKIGDLAVGDPHETEAMTRAGTPTRGQLERCAKLGAEWLALSEDGKSVVFKSPFNRGPKLEVRTAYCDDTTILLGGDQRGKPDDAAHQRAMMFTFWKTDAARFGPTTEVFFKKYAVGSGADAARYVLTEIRAIDGTARKILFAATSGTGESVLLVAPFALDPTLPKHPTLPAAATP